MSARSQSLISRAFWFGVGAVLSYLLISTPLKFLRLHTNLPVLAISVLSTGVSVTFFFFWNYYVNFRTAAGRTGALGRYLTISLVMWMASSAVLTLFMKVFPQMASARPLGIPVNLNVVSTQLMLGFLKFFLYHTWAFPAVVPSQEPETDAVKEGGSDSVGPE